MRARDRRDSALLLWLPELLDNMRFSGYLELALSPDEWAGVNDAPLGLLAELYPDEFEAFESQMLPPDVYEKLGERAQALAAMKRAERLARQAENG